MRFKKTVFYGFRNVKPYAIEWSAGFNVITGINGSGKTNLIEGLNLLSGWGPLERGTRISSLLQWDADSIKASLFSTLEGESEDEITAVIGNRCILRWNGTVIRASEMRYRLPVLTFLPAHLSLINGSASHRRALMDILGALIYPSYAKLLYDYKRLLRHRVALLRKSCSPVPTDLMICNIGSKIWKMRESTIEQLSLCLKKYSNLLPAPITLTFVRGGGNNCLSAEQDFALSLKNKMDKEYYSKIPQVGPQRDDLTIESSGRLAREALSRGHSRRTAIALILASAWMVEKILKKRPILLLDEINAELDAQARQVLFSVLSEGGIQVFATTTEIDQSFYSGYAEYKVVAGAINPY